MSAEISFYVNDETGQVHRKVVRDLSGVTVVTSDVPVAPDVATFRLAHPNVSLQGEVRAEKTLREIVESADDAALAELGLSRQAPAAEPPRNPAEETDFPIHEGAGWYRLSNGERERGRQSALSAQAEIDEAADAVLATAREFEGGNPDESEE